MSGSSSAATSDAVVGERRGLRRILFENGLGLFFGAILLLALTGQAFSGLAAYNDQARVGGFAQIGLGEYLTSSEFAVDVAENWQSEYLQFLLFVLGTVWLVQRGSPESKTLDKAGPESDKDEKLGAWTSADSPRWAKVGGWRTQVFSHSLGLVMGLVFLGSWAAQLVAGTTAHNAERLMDLREPVTTWGYASSPDFWNRTFQNWQSEFLAVASMVVFSIYLRERGSPESKPVGEPHDSTGVEN